MNEEGTQCFICDEGSKVTKLEAITEKSKISDIKRILTEHLDSHNKLANAQNGFLLWNAPKLVTKVVSVKDTEMHSYLSLI